MNRYVKIPLITGLSFALTQAALTWLLGGDTQDLLARTLFNFTAFALLGLLLTYAHNRVVRGKVRGASEEAFGVRQRRVFTLRLPSGEAFALCEESLGAIGAKAKSVDRAAGKIEAATGWTLKTFGCVISYEVRPVGERLTEVEVTSRPKVRTTLVDYGENREIVERVGEFFFERDDGLDFGLVGDRLKELAEGRLHEAEGFKSAARRPRENA